MWEVQAYLNRLKEKDKGFDFRIVADGKGEAKGAVWQTAFMRGNFEKFGEVLFLDACKRKLNYLHWPYIGLVVIDGDQHINVVLEGIVCGEQVDSYIFALDSLFVMSEHVRKKEEVFTMFCDKFLNRQNSISLFVTLGIQHTCRLFWDYYHITTENWPATFGTHNWVGELREGMMGMIHAESKEEFEICQSKAKEAASINPVLLQKIEDWVVDAKFWARHRILQWKATLGRLGSSHAEQNHHSVTSFLGKLYEAPEQEIRFLLDRNQRLMGLTNMRLSTRFLQLQSEKVGLNGRFSALHEGKFVLSEWGYELWKKEWHMHTFYKKRRILKDNCFEVWHQDFPNSITTITKNGTCSCATTKHEMIQCRHHICISDGKVDLTQFSQRWIISEQAHVCLRSLDTHQSRLEAEDVSMLDVGVGVDGVSMMEVGMVVDAEEVIPSDHVTDSQKQWKPTHTFMMGLAQELVSLSQQCNKQHVIVGGLCKMIEAMKGQSSLIKLSVEDVCHLQYMSSGVNKQTDTFSHTLTQYVECPQEKENAHETAMLAITPPTTVPQLFKGGKKRFKSIHEIKRRPPQKGSIICSFCLMHGHNKSSCDAMKSMGIQLQSSAHKISLLSNLKHVSLSLLPKYPPMQSLPKDLATLVFHGSCKTPNGEIVVFVSGFSKGLTRHIMFPEESEPHSITEFAATSWICGVKSRKNTFVKHESLLVNINYL